MISTGFDRALLEVATWLLLGCGCWATLLCIAALVESGTAGRVHATAWVGCPPRLRRALLAGLGLALAGSGTAAPATGSTGPLPPHGSGATASAGLPVPARPVGTTSTGRPAASVVVRPGDSLWRLAAERAGARASPRQVADLVRWTHHRNRAVIGPDPDLLHPGQRLVLPASRHDRPREERP
jgi:nucleoid-associated protein YgaU